LQVAAALSYYFILSVFPGLILLSAVVGFIPLPDLFGRVLMLMGWLLPPDTMHVVYAVLTDVLSSHRATWLSFGMVGIIWTGSSAFDAVIEAMDIAYDVPESRPYWKTRLLAVALAAIIGILLLTALAVMMAGPHFGEWLAVHLQVPSSFGRIWPVLHWSIAISFTVLAVELVYFLAPNVKQRFSATLPGALLSVFVWNGLSYLLGIYFRHFANFNRTYGTLGGLIALMVWLYWTSLALLVGAEMNAELAKESRQGYVRPKQKSQTDTGHSTDSSDLDHAA
jgi:membrane protein